LVLPLLFQQKLSESLLFSSSDSIVLYLFYSRSEDEEYLFDSFGSRSRSLRNRCSLLHHTPISRANQKQTQAGCRGPACLGPCEVTKVQALTPPASIARGDTIQITWPRNNHAGGFVRYAWAPFDQSDDMAVFDSNEQLYTCFEIGSSCGPSDPTNPNGGDDGAQLNCGYSLVVPGYLTDGKWTMQWAWFGGAFTLGDYYGCVDYNVAGGPSSNKQGSYFKGGDYSNPNQPVCKYFSTDRLHNCINEPCNAPNANKPGENVGAPFNIAIGAPPDDNGGSSDSERDIPCQSNSDCPSGVCQVNNICYRKSRGGLDAGGIAALFFAFLFVALVAIAVIFVIMNKTEWRNWKPFSKK